MACIKPLKGWLSREVSPTTGRRRPVFQFDLGVSDLPVEVPCGRCHLCLIKKTSDWATRCEKEAKLHEHNAFITLTYDDAHLPMGGAARSTLCKRDWQLFMKRLRFNYGKPIRNFTCGEYGDLSERAHMHAILFGFWDADSKLVDTRRNLYTSPLVSQAWQNQGFITVGHVTWKSAAYVAGYVLKKLSGPMAVEAYGDREPPFSLQSRRPGIGSGWYDKFKGEVYPAGTIVVGEGKQRCAPTYFDNKFREEDPAAFSSMKLRRAMAAGYAEGLKPDNHVEVQLHKIKSRPLQREPGAR